MRYWLLGSRTLAIFLCAWQIEAAFAEEHPEKDRYNLFSPTPDSLLRELSTDRPDKTESAYTVDAGHFQVEMDLLTYAVDRSEDERVKTLAIAPINLKVGLLNNVDLQVVIQSYNIQETHDRDANTKTRASGFGDILLRCKTNLWGNDGGPTAFAVMPFLKFPTNQDDLGNHALEGGIIFPLAIGLPGGWDLGAMLEVDHAQDANRSDYHQEIIETVTFGHAIVGALSGYVEFFSNVSTEEEAGWIATLDFGLTYEVHRNLQLDAGINIGLTDAADDLNPFVGLSVRY